MPPEAQQEFLPPGFSAEPPPMPAPGPLKDVKADAAARNPPRTATKGYVDVAGPNGSAAAKPVSTKGYVDAPKGPVATKGYVDAEPPESSESPGTRQFHKMNKWLFTPLAPDLSEKTKRRIAATLTRSDPETVAEEHPYVLGATEGITEFGRSLTEPFSIATIAGGPIIGGVGEVVGLSPRAIQGVSATLSGLFAAQAAHGTYTDAKAAYDAYLKGNNREAARATTSAILNFGAGAFAGAHAARGGYDVLRSHLADRLSGEAPPLVDEEPPDGGGAPGPTEPPGPDPNDPDAVIRHRQAEERAQKRRQQEEIEALVAQHADAHAAVRRDLENIVPEKRAAVLEEIRRRGIEAYGRGDREAAGKEALHQHIMEQIIAEGEGITPPQVTPEAVTEPPPEQPPVAPDQPRAGSRGESGAPQPETGRRTTAVATAEREEAPPALQEATEPVEATAPVGEPPNVQALADEIRESGITRQQMLDELGLAPDSPDARVGNGHLAIRLAMQRLAAKPITPVTLPPTTETSTKPKRGGKGGGKAKTQPLVTAATTATPTPEAPVIPEPVETPETPPAPTSVAAETPPAPKPKAARRSKKQEAEDEAARKALADHFTPGNVIYSDYWKKHDKVLSFKPAGEDGMGWQVQVIDSDKNGNPTPGAQPRLHSTYPDPKDKVVLRAPETPAAAPEIPAPTPEPAPTAEPQRGHVGDIAAELQEGTAAPTAAAATTATPTAPVTPESAAAGKPAANIDYNKEDKAWEATAPPGYVGPDGQKEMVAEHGKGKPYRTKPLAEQVAKEWAAGLIPVEQYHAQHPEAPPTAHQAAPTPSATPPPVTTPEAPVTGPEPPAISPKPVSVAPPAGPLALKYIAGSSPAKYEVVGHPGVTIRRGTDGYVAEDSDGNKHIGDSTNLDEVKAKTREYLDAKKPKSLTPEQSYAEAAARSKEENGGLAAAKDSERHGAPVVAVNDSAMALLDNLLENEVPSNGLVFTAEQADAVIAEMRLLFDDDPEKSAGLAALANLMESHRTPNGNVVLHRNILSDGHINRVTLEELFHDWQHRHLIPAKKVGAMHSRMLKSDSAEAWQKVIAGLKAPGLEYKHPAATIEAPAWVAAGDYAHFGISKDEAVQLLADYFQNAHEILGGHALENLPPIAESLKDEVLNEIKRRDLGKPEKDHEGGGAERVDPHQPAEQRVSDKLQGRGRAADRAAQSTASEAELKTLQSRQRERDVAPVWYLKSERVVADKMKGPMPGPDVLRMLENNGISRDELKWTGLDDFLPTAGRVTPEQVRNLISENGIKIEEVRKGQFPDEKKKLDALNARVQNGDRLSPEEAAEYDRLTDREMMPRQVGAAPKYKEQQLPGGSNYRELLLTLPEQAATKDQAAQSIFHLNYDQLGPRQRLDADRLLASGKLTGKAEGMPSSFRTRHWDEPNVLAHVRMNDRTTGDGKRLLHLEEVQSDWHQKGRKEGYSEDLSKVPLRAVRHDGYWEVYTEGGQFVTNVQDWQHPEIKSEEGVIQEARRRVTEAPERIRQEKVPDAPFKKTWKEMALRRVLRYAAEHDYDGVSWTGGEDQVDRYNLAKHISELRYKKTPDGKYDLHAYWHEGGKEDLGIMPADRLAEYVGQGLADKITNGEGEERPGGRRRLIGNDLKVGGEWMHELYDKIIPNYLNKFGKKFGARVGEASISAPRQSDIAHRRFELLNPNGEITGQYPTRAEAERAANHKIANGSGNWPAGLNWKVNDGYPEADRAVQYLPITDEMYESALDEGVPMFQSRQFNREAYKTPRDEYVDKQWHPDETDEERRVRYHRRQEWEQSAMAALSEGKVTPEEAKKKDWYVHPKPEAFKPLPEKLYHVTTARDAVAKTGPLPRWELEMGSGLGLGGGDDKSISFTTDLKTAKAIEHGIRTAQRVAAGDLTVQNMVDMVNRGEGAPRPFPHEFQQALQAVIGGRDPLGTALREEVTEFSMRGEAPERGEGWEPDLEGYHWTGGDGVERYSRWKRPMTDDEKADSRWRVFKAFSPAREWAGGMEDPLFFSNDIKGLAKLDPRQIATLQYAPEPGAMGTQESALGEWRTYSGRTVKLVGEGRPSEDDMGTLQSRQRRSEVQTLEKPAEEKEERGPALKTDTPEFKRWFGDSKVVDDGGKPIKVYRGDFKGSGLGNSFKVSRATSGRFYFTDNPEIASNYATGKADSRHAEEHQEYGTWFKFPAKKYPRERTTPNANDTWHRLSPEERERVRHAAMTTTQDDEGNIVFDADSPINGKQGMEWEAKQHGGNWLRAMVESWLSSGVLYGDERRFGQILRHIGLDYEYNDPREPNSMVTPVYLKIANPLDTGRILPHVVERLNDLAKRDRSRASIGYDQWDKSTVTPREWVDRLNRDLKENSTHAWTSVPEKVTQALQGMGYDGIKDTGGKMGGKGHTVWIAFEPTQIKSAIGNRGTFDPESSNILQSRQPEGAAPLETVKAEAKPRDPKDNWLLDGVKKFIEDRGGHFDPNPPEVDVDHRAKDIADAYHAMQHEPDNPKVKAAFDALKHDIDEQWDFATKDMGVKFEPWNKPGQPYNNSAEMVADVKNNKRLYFFRGGDLPSDHPGLEIDPKTGLDYREKVRAVHDLFGHAVHGYQFGPKGEENAWMAHARMFSEEALPAITAGTKGQNSWVNFGPHMRRPDGSLIKKGEPGWLPQTERPYAEQKAGLLPQRFNYRTDAPAPVSFLSPNVYDMKTIGDAQRRLSSVPHRLLKSESEWLADALGLTAEQLDAIGHWEGGAENSTVRRFVPGASADAITYHAAIMARAARQNFFGAFIPGKGKDILFQFTVPASSGGPQEIADLLATHGIKDSTIEKAKDGHTVIIATAPGKEPPVDKAVESLGAINVKHFTGRSHFEGNGSSRDGAGDVFLRLIEEREAVHPEWRDIRTAIESRPDFVELGRRVGAEERRAAALSQSGSDGGLHESSSYTYRREVQGNVGRLRVLGAKVKESWSLDPAKVAELKAHGINSPDFHELDSGDPKAADAFHASISALKQNNPFHASVHVYPKEDYANMRLFLTADGKAGFAIKPDGDMVSGFTKGADAKGAAHTLFEIGKRSGGVKNDCFDTTLPFYYSKHGFKVVARLPWNEEYAPAGWDKATYAEFNNGEPDVVFMVHDPAAGLYKPWDGETVDEYDEGSRLQDEALKEIASRKPAGPEEEPDIGILQSRQRKAGKLAELQEEAERRNPHGSTVPLMESALVPRYDSVDDIAAHLEDHTRQALKKLLPGDKPRHHKAMVDRAVGIARDELKYQLAQENSGADWYTTDIRGPKDSLISEMKKIHPELKDPTKERTFLLHVAITSPGKKAAFDNVNIAEQAYDLYKKTGKIPLTQPDGTPWGSYGNAPLKTAQALLKHFKGDEAKAMEWMLTKHTLAELEAVKKKSGFSPKTVRNALPPDYDSNSVYGAYILGEKVGPFFMNLNGISTELTVDRWYMRTWNRLMGTLVGPDGTIQDVPRGKNERAAMLEATRQLEEEFGLPTSGVQAALWYYEQGLYSRLGQKGKFGGTYANAAKEVRALRSRGYASLGEENAARGNDAAQRGTGGGAGAYPGKARGKDTGGAGERSQGSLFGNTSPERVENQPAHGPMALEALKERAALQNPIREQISPKVREKLLKGLEDQRRELMYVLEDDETPAAKRKQALAALERLLEKKAALTVQTNVSRPAGATGTAAR